MQTTETDPSVERHSVERHSVPLISARSAELHTLDLLQWNHSKLMPFVSARSAELHFGTKSRKSRRTGLSLLEVVLALSILAVAAGLLAQITKQATDNGLLAQRLATAQMLCESKMSEVLAGAIPLTTSSWTQITDSGKGNFYYQIQTESAQRPNMIGVRLSVTDQPDSSTSNPELFFIVRWMIDPSLGLDTPPTATESTGSSTSGSTGSAGGVP